MPTHRFARAETLPQIAKLYYATTDAASDARLERDALVQLLCTFRVAIEDDSGVTSLRGG